MTIPLDRRTLLPAHRFTSSDCATLAGNRVERVVPNRADTGAYAALWLMAQCRHFNTANNTFSWWAARLGGEKEKIVVTPGLKMDGRTARGFKRLIPNEWLRV